MNYHANGWTLYAETINADGLPSATSKLLDCSQNFDYIFHLGMLRKAQHPELWVGIRKHRAGDVLIEWRAVEEMHITLLCANLARAAGTQVTGALADDPNEYPF